ncbi:hypothetical protein M2475_000421 [Breznakia sp. PF5-3]|uniref:SseB family protein n=1 Tax=unclassified Breznakia TaxID=2623764 RepID=UPI0024066576|nr:MULTISPECIES: SseB family protein [unclassified Breznakia]MDF9824065.1 hypothetical protein [Breznakia sp. PM6-1]MDF9834869.1 hypothetical protein [Breznakia sp. PF5-3]MDF9837109.1 hypothetical protein [Breznakia sp. PFB2-8]MDF9859034.1 hypothetical protein [Breznakia sp. PH5-24]
MSLDSTFEKAFHDEAMQQKFFYELLLNDVYIIAASDLEGNRVVEGDNLKIFTINHEDEVYVPLFLSMNALADFLDENETPYVKANAADILETLKENNVVINPGQEESIILYSDEIKGLLQQGLN